MIGEPLQDIRQLGLPEIEGFLKSSGEPGFRVKQVFDWLWKKNCRSFDEMTSLSKTTRQKLTCQFKFPVVTLDQEYKSSDGTIKSVFLLEDGMKVEGVLIPTDGRTTACISSQVGCALGCNFCATGKLGFRRNLTSPEIYDQVFLINNQSEKYFGTGISNIVFMGMGEPLLNYSNLCKAIEKITSPDSMGMSPQRLTVSTVGIPKMIRQIADDQAKFHLAISLHAPTNEKRDKIIPLNAKFPLSELTEALKFYHQKTKKRITLEYILFGNFNDSLADAAELARFCKSFPVKINLIEYNQVENSEFRESTQIKIKQFHDFLESKNLVVNIRRSKGKDIDAACGQLALKEDRGVSL